MYRILVPALRTSLKPRYIKNIVSLTSTTPRTYITSHPPNRKDSEKEKYDQLLREQIIRATFQRGVPMVAPSPGVLQQIKNTAKMLGKGYGILVAIYILLQLFMARRDKEDSNTSVFIPLVFKFSRSGYHRYQFPHELQYVDQRAHDYFVTELNQLSKHKSEDLDVALSKQSALDSYKVVLQHENVKYQVLEQLSKHHTIKKLMGIPIFLEDGPLDPSKYLKDTFGFEQDFNIWVEVKTPIVSGLQIDLDGEGLLRSLWKVKSLNFGESSIQHLFSLVEKTFDHIDSLDLILTIPETIGQPDGDHLIEKSGVKKVKDYDIYYVGEFEITDNTKETKGRVVYVGTIDFNHLAINRGVKLLSLKLIMENETYKLL